MRAFLNDDLLPQVKRAFALFHPAARAVNDYFRSLVDGLGAKAE